MLNLSKGEAKARAEQAQLLTPRRSLTGEALPPLLPAAATELAAGAIGPTHLRVITATMRRIPPSTHPEVAAQAEQTLATAARRFDPAALSRIGERLLAHLDPDGNVIGFGIDNGVDFLGLHDVSADGLRRGLEYMRQQRQQVRRRPTLAYQHAIRPLKS